MKSIGELLYEIVGRHDRHDQRIDLILAGQKRIEDKLEILMNANLTLTGEIASLHASVNAQKTAIDGATVLLNGIQARVEAAVAKALANGATQSQLADIQQVVSDLDIGTAQLAAAVASVPAVASPTTTGATTTSGAPTTTGGGA